MAVRRLNKQDNCHLDTLLEAFDRLQRTENKAAADEGMSPVCHRIGFWRVNEIGDYIVGIEFGMLSEGTTFKPAYVVKVHDFLYELKWQ